MLFVKVQRKFNFYLRALWGRDFFIRPTGADFADFRPYIGNRILYMPDAVDNIKIDDDNVIEGLELYRATAAHMASHMCYSTSSVSAEQLSPAQVFFIGLLEDARVEYKAIKAFPGLKKLWKSLMEVEYEDDVEHETMLVLERIALMLLDSDVKTDDLAISQFVSKFHDEIEEKQDDNHFSWLMGMELFNMFAGKKAIPSLRILERYRISYRDDNRIIWHFEDADWETEFEYVSAS